MRNFLWNIGGKFDRDIDFLTKLTDMIPFVEADKKSSFNIYFLYLRSFISQSLTALSQKMQLGFDQIFII